MTSTSDTNVSVMEPNQSFAQAADNNLTRPDPPTDHTAAFATATSSPPETGSEEDQEVAFRLSSRSYSQEYVFKMHRSRSFQLVSNSTYHILIIPIFEHSI